MQPIGRNSSVLTVEDILQPDQQPIVVNMYNQNQQPQVDQWCDFLPNFTPPIATNTTKSKLVAGCMLKFKYQLVWFLRDRIWWSYNQQPGCKPIVLDRFSSSTKCIILPDATKSGCTESRECIFEETRTENRSGFIDPSATSSGSGRFQYNFM